MRFLHLSDLHLGKRMNGYSLIEDQRYFLFDVVLPALKENATHLVLLSGDIFDLSSPSGEALDLFDSFLQALVQEGVSLIGIPGNHDSAERIHYASSFLKQNGIHLITSLKEARTYVEIEGIRFYGIPFSHNGDFLGEIENPPKEFPARFSAYIDSLNLDASKTNILLLHQTLSNAKGEVNPSGSESTYIGASASLPASLFSAFDYVALGHIHKSYPPSKNSYYAGSPLKYHADEAKDKKELTSVEVNGKTVRRIPYPFVPLRDLLEIEGTFSELMSHEKVEDYVAVTLMDGETIDHPKDRLQQTVFPYILSVKRKDAVTSLPQDLEMTTLQSASLSESFERFFQESMEKELTPYQIDLIAEAEKASKGEME